MEFSTANNKLEGNILEEIGKSVTLERLIFSNNSLIQSHIAHRTQTKKTTTDTAAENLSQHTGNRRSPPLTTQNDQIPLHPNNPRNISSNSIQYSTLKQFEGRTLKLRHKWIQNPLRNHHLLKTQIHNLLQQWNLDMILHKVHHQSCPLLA
ncbi:hypothetical protein L2E82_37003 [Cichorium intybus]|uniref:Uncharacterized protein n=1 Tax=Cichorium intybus TaxID=13427 RepID=A0ACB9AHV0_CICIN|nr:hypothetical protein L2E82_37003 [Cichorium intybus]